MWRCERCGQQLENDVAHYDGGHTCPGFLVDLSIEAYDEDQGYSLKKRLQDAFFITLPFNVTFAISFFVTGAQHISLIAASIVMTAGTFAFSIFNNVTNHP